MKMIILIFTAILGFFVVNVNFAMAYTADGNMSDWGVNPGIEQWAPNPGVFYTVNPPVGPDGEVGPGGGGQLFHASAFYVTADNANFYLALVIGFPNTGIDQIDERGEHYYYSAGDIALDFGSTGSYGYGVEIGGHLPNHYDASCGIPLNGTPGGVYKITSPNQWEPAFGYPESSPLFMLENPVYAGSAYEFAYNDIYYGSDHWVVELAISKSVFGEDWRQDGTAHWTQSCGNDNINVAVSQAVTPEPISMVLTGAGLFGLLGTKLRKRKSLNS